MQFIAEQKGWLRRLLRRNGSSASRHEVERLAAAIEASIEAVERNESKAGTFREAHNALRALFLMITADDPSIGQIRARASSLPIRARAHVERRAKRLRPSDFSSEGAFWKWTQSAPAEDLLSFLRIVIADGGMMAAGRRRPRGSRSRPHFEPSVMGIARRASREPMPSGDNGRPPASRAEQLIMYLAVDWTMITGKPPAPGRSDATPFGDLIHQVFGWLGWPGADQALRRYWEAVEREGARPMTSKG